MLTTDLDALPIELITQLASPHDRVFQVQFVESAHDAQIALRNRLRQVVHTAATDA